MGKCKAYMVVDKKFAFVLNNDWCLLSPSHHRMDRLLPEASLPQPCPPTPRAGTSANSSFAHPMHNRYIPPSSAIETDVTALQDPEDE